jgi:hypothetical protein
MLHNAKVTGAVHLRISMDATTLADRLAISDAITRLFVYTDRRDWNGLLDEVFTEQVEFDMSAFGDTPGPRSARAIVDGWNTGFQGLDAVHHQAGNHLIDLRGDRATVHADAIAMHAKNSATKGRTRTFVGSYTIGLVRTARGWRIDGFTYHLKFADGNVDLV